MTGPWIVMCQVSGGVTGFRQAPLKADGVIRTFATEDAAALEARRLTAQMNAARCLTASVAEFSYWPELADERAAPRR